jgi:hypothetical protein
MNHDSAQILHEVLRFFDSKMAVSESPYYLFQVHDCALFARLSLDLAAGKAGIQTAVSCNLGSYSFEVNESFISIP